jgi:hypothetical protein
LNRHDLGQLLTAERVRVDEYSVDGELRDNSLCLEHKSSGGWLVYYLDRGDMVGTRRFDSEELACDFFAEKILAQPGNRIGVHLVNGKPAPLFKRPQ